MVWGYELEILSKFSVQIVIQFLEEFSKIHMENYTLGLVIGHFDFFHTYHIKNYNFSEVRNMIEKHQLVQLLKPKCKFKFKMLLCV